MNPVCFVQILKAGFQRLPSVVVASAALATLAVPAHANLVSNGSFETTTSYGQMIGGSYATVADWSTTGYNFIFNPANNTATTTGSVNGQYGGLSLWTPIQPSPDGGNYIGADGAFQIGAITQSITGLTIGQSYALSFYWGAAQQSGYTGATTDKWTVQLGNESFSTSVLDDASHAFSGWKQQTFTYIATQTTETLSFLATGTPSGVPPFALLDGVTLNQVPEPSSLALQALGLLGLAAIWIRRKNVG